MATILKQIDRYDRQLIKSELASAWTQMGGLETLLGDRRRVLLKPNFVVPERASKAATTHPDVYLAIAELLLESGREVAIGESPAFGSAQMAVKAHGAWEECQSRGIEVLTFRKASNYDGVADDPKYRSLTIAGELERFDALINVPKLKVHQQFTFTGAAKNLYGCVTGKRKFCRHNQCANDVVRFGRMILANANRANPILNIGDGITAMHVRGPRGGSPYPLNRLIVSDSILAHDWLFCELIGLAPSATPLFQAAEQAQCQAAAEDCTEALASAAFARAEGFVHARPIHVSFSPYHIARSLWRTAKYRLQDWRLPNSQAT